MDRTPTLFQKALAELLGTGFLVLIGPGSIPAAILLLNGGKVAFTMADLGFSDWPLLLLSRLWFTRLDTFLDVILTRLLRWPLL
ncbi:MAG TPA: hypothetical protein VF458_21525 [Ktedonobacteraceae bacterium]